MRAGLKEQMERKWMGVNAAAFSITGWIGIVAIFSRYLSESLQHPGISSLNSVLVRSS